LVLQIAEAETRLKQQQNLYEAVRADRNLYSKNLIQSQDEIQEMKRKFKIMVSARALGNLHLSHLLCDCCGGTAALLGIAL
jgi:hypothetical protein